MVFSVEDSQKKHRPYTDHLADELRLEQPNVKLTIHVEPPKKQ